MVFALIGRSALTHRTLSLLSLSLQDDGHIHRGRVLKFTFSLASTLFLMFGPAAASIGFVIWIIGGQGLFFAPHRPYNYWH